MMVYPRVSHHTRKFVKNSLSSGSQDGWMAVVQVHLGIWCATRGSLGSCFFKGYPCSRLSSQLSSRPSEQHESYRATRVFVDWMIGTRELLGATEETYRQQLRELFVLLRGPIQC